MPILFGWFLLLVLQNAAFTWVSRARNSGSLAYHCVAAVFSNGIWFVSQLFLIGMVARPEMELRQLVLLGAIYIAGTVTGSVLMHYVSMRWLEAGKRQVGANAPKKSVDPWAPNVAAVQPGDLMSANGERWLEFFLQVYPMMVAQRGVLLSWFANVNEAGKSIGYDKGYAQGRRDGMLTARTPAVTTDGAPATTEAGERVFG